MTLKKIFILNLSISLTSLAFSQDEQAEPKPVNDLQPLEISDDLRKKVSTGMGYIEGQTIAMKLKNMGFTMKDFSAEEFARGVMMAINEEESQIKIKDYKVGYDLFKAKLQERELQLGEKNLIESKEWLQSNAAKENIKTTESGLQYEIITAGDGEVFEEYTDGRSDLRQFLITFESRTLDGKLIEASPEKRVMAVRKNLMQGLEEGLKMMPVGSSWKLFLSPELGYGNNRMGASLEPNQVAMIKVNLLGIADPEKQEKAESPEESGDQE